MSVNGICVFEPTTLSGGREGEQSKCGTHLMNSIDSRCYVDFSLFQIRKSVEFGSLHCTDEVLFTLVQHSINFQIFSHKS